MRPDRVHRKLGTLEQPVSSVYRALFQPADQSNILVANHQLVALDRLAWNTSSDAGICHGHILPFCRYLSLPIPAESPVCAGSRSSGACGGYAHLLDADEHWRMERLPATADKTPSLGKTKHFANEFVDNTDGTRTGHGRDTDN